MDLPRVVVVDHGQQDVERAEVGALQFVRDRLAVFQKSVGVARDLLEVVVAVGDGLLEAACALIGRFDEDPQESGGFGRTRHDPRPLLDVGAELGHVSHLFALRPERVDLLGEHELRDREHERDARDERDDHRREQRRHGARRHEFANRTRAEHVEDDESHVRQQQENPRDEPTVRRDEKPDLRPALADALAHRVGRSRDTIGIGRRVAHRRSPPRLPSERTNCRIESIPQL